MTIDFRRTQASQGYALLIKVNAMTKIIQLDAVRKQKEHEALVESQFIELLDKEAQKDGNIQPLSNSLIKRIDALKQRAKERKREHELLEC